MFYVRVKACRAADGRGSSLEETRRLSFRSAKGPSGVPEAGSVAPADIATAERGRARPILTGISRRLIPLHELCSHCSVCVDATDSPKLTSLAGAAAFPATVVAVSLQINDVVDYTCRCIYWFYASNKIFAFLMPSSNRKGVSESR